MRRKVVVTGLIMICFLLQTTVFQALSFASISPNLLIVAVSSFGFMRGKKEGMFIGFFSGRLIDLFFGDVLGFYALLYMYVGYVNGFRKQFDIGYYFLHLMIPELVYTLLVTILLYWLILKINQWLEKSEKRSEAKFV